MKKQCAHKRDGQLQCKEQVGIFNVRHMQKLKAFDKPSSVGAPKMNLEFKRNRATSNSCNLTCQAHAESANVGGHHPIFLEDRKTTSKEFYCANTQLDQEMGLKSSTAVATC